MCKNILWYYVFILPSSTNIQIYFIRYVLFAVNKCFGFQNMAVNLYYKCRKQTFGVYQPVLPAIRPPAAELEQQQLHPPPHPSRIPCKLHPTRFPKGPTTSFNLHQSEPHPTSIQHSHPNNLHKSPLPRPPDRFT